MTNEDQGQNVERMRKLDTAWGKIMSLGSWDEQASADLKRHLKEEAEAKTLRRLQVVLKTAVATIYREDGTKEVVPATPELLAGFNMIAQTTDKMLSVRFNGVKKRSSQKVNVPGRTILRRFVKEQARHLPMPPSPYGDILVLYTPYPGAGQEE